ncbi:MAG: polyprenyl synthetase family protein [Spirochaetales bacterium]|nr:polyprenyl synthetase family protein [Spirochaetales bacterium]
MKEDLSQISEIMVDVLNDSPTFIREDLEPMFNSPGKMLRPAFVILASGAGNKPKEEKSPFLYSTAAAIELVHIAALIHDDIIDQANERRGVQTLNSNIGIKRAVLSGDYILLRALELASYAHDKKMIDEMNRTSRALCLSEIEQDAGKGDYFISREDYFNRINGKTAVLFSLACKVGALLGGASGETAEKMFLVGKNFGMGFQIEDDILDYTGTKDKLGKAVGKDLREGIPTLPLILALESGNPSITRMCSSKFRIGLGGIIRRKVVSNGFALKAGEIAESFREESLNLLSEFDFREQKTLAGIIQGLKSREQ